MSFGGQGKDRGPYLQAGQQRDIVGEKIGMSGKQYDRAKFLANRAPQEVIDELDRGERSIRGTYDELRATEKGPKAKVASAESSIPAPVIETDLERAIRAESELDAFKYRQHNEIFHRDSIIENLKIRVAELEAALDAANARIRELGGVPHGTGTSL